MSCFVCEAVVATTEEHHVVPQSRGGKDGPTVTICANCHSATHIAARKMIAGKSPDAYLAHYDHDQRGRALVLIKTIVAVESMKDDRRNPHPVLSVNLDHHCYLVALNMLQRDRGFSSRDKLVNELLRKIAVQYGLIEDEERTVRARMVPLSALRGGKTT